MSIGRIIGGLAVPYGTPALRNGEWSQFDKGSLVWPSAASVKLLINHDSSLIAGRAIELTEYPGGLFARFKVAHNLQGDRAYALVRDEIYTGLSIGMDDFAHYTERDGIVYADPGNLLVEISITPVPAYDRARARTM